MNACEHIVDATNVVDIEVALVLLVIRRVDIGYNAVAVPLEVSHVGVLSHDAVDDAVHIILHLRVGDVEHELIAIIICVALRLQDNPVGMLLKQFALRVHHLRLNPYTELHTSLLCVSYKTRNTLRQLALCSLPVAQSGVVVLARILIGEPSVVEQEHIYAEVLGILHQFGKTLLVEVEACILPVVQESEAVAHTHVHLILTSPVVQVARSLAHTIVAHREDELRSGEHLACLQLIVGSVRIDGRNDAKRADIVHLKGEAEVTGPAYRAEHHLALVLLGRLVEAQLEERLSLHSGTCAELCVDNLFARAQLGCLGLTFFSPVAVIVSEIIL